MTILRPVRLPHARLPITRRSRAAARILPVLAASLALAAGADPARASAPSISAASDTLTVTLSAPEGGTVAEGATGHFEVTVAGSTAAGAVKVRYSVSGTAEAGEDYTALSGEATVAQGESVARIALEALEDGILDKGETVVLALTGATGPGTVLVDQTAATATIADNGTVKVSLTAVPDTIGEGSSWNSTMTMSTPVADRVSVRWWTTDGTALAGRDYTAADEVVSFQPGETSKPISVQTLEDDNTETVEVFYVSMGLPIDAARTGTEEVLKVDPTPQSAFIECSVRFPQRGPIVFELMPPVKSGQVIGTVAAETTDGIPYYELDDGGDNKFTINALTAQISTTAALDPGLYELEVTVQDECGAQASVDVTVVVKQPNRSPNQVNSIPDTMLVVGESATVDVSEYFSDPDDDPLTYTASSSDAAKVGVSIDDSEVTYKALKAGSATVTVTADDGRGGTAEQAFLVTVKPPNEPPEADAGGDQTVDEGDRVDLDGRGSRDSDGTIEGWEWKGPVALTDRGTSTPYFTAPTEGVTKWYTFTLTVEDNDGATDSDSVTIKVVPPECKIDVGNGDFTVPENEKVVGTVGVTAEHCGALDYELSGTGAEDVSAAAVSSRDNDAAIMGNFDYERRKLYDLTLTVSERNGSASGTGRVDIEVTNVNEQPTVDDEIDDLTLYVGEGTIDLSDVFSDPDGDPLTYSAKSSNTAVATATVSGSTLTVRATGKGEARVTVTARDPGGLEAVDAFDVEVPNREPVVDDPIDDQRLYVGDPPNKADIELSEVFGDPDGDKLGYTAKSSDPTVATATVSGSTLTVRATGKGEARVTVTARDPGGLEADDVFDVEVPNRKPKPKGTIPDDTVDVGESGSVNVLSKFEDPDGDGLDFSAVASNKTVLAVSVSGSEVTYEGLKAGSATVTVTAEDTGGLTARQRFDVEVYEPTRPCTITFSDAALSVAENAGRGSALNDDVSVTASDCGTLSYALKGTGSDDFSVAAAGASDDNARIKVAKRLNHEVRDSYALKLTVSSGSVSDTRNVDISVKDVNEAPKPKGTIRNRTVQVGTPGSVDVANYFTDEDAGDRLTFSSESSATGRLTVNASGSPVKLTGVAPGSATVTITARDRGGLTATQVFSVKVDPAPTTPCGITVSDGTLSVPEDAGTGDGVDGKVGVETTGDCGTLSYALAGDGAADFRVAAAGSSDDDAKIGVAKALDHETNASYALKLTVSSGSVSHTGDVDISVTDVNEAPQPSGTISKQTVRVGQPGSVDVTNYFTDEDAGDRLTFASESSATGRLTVNASGSPVTLTGVSAGSATVTVTARDRGGLTATQVFAVKVDPAPTPCEITVSDGNLAVREDARVGGGVDGEVGVTATGDCGTLSYALTGTGSGDFSVAAAGASDDDAKIKVAKKLNHEGRDAYDLTLTVSWGSVSGAGDVDISVTDVNEAPKPKGAIGNRTIRVGRPGSVDVANYFTDEDAGDRLTFASESSATSRLTVNASGSPVKLTGVAAGSATVTVTARDRGGLTATQVFSVKVDPAPATPCGITVSDGTLSVPEDASAGDGVDGKVGVETTGDCGTLSYALAGDGAADFTVSAAGSSDDDAKIGVAKALDHETTASYALTLTVSEAGGDASDDGDVAISVTDVNEAPEVAGAIPALTVSSGDSKVLDVSAHFRDPDGDALTYEAVSSKETVATVKVNGSEVTVTGVSPGESVVTVTARDAHGATVSQGFEVTVVNEAPEVVSAIPALTVGAGDAKVVDVSGHFRDPNGDALTYEASSSKETVATVKVDGSEVTVTGVLQGESQVTVTARDAHGAAVSQGFEVTVGPDNAAPVVERALPDLTVAADSSVVVDLSAHFRDPDGDTLSYAASSSNEGAATVGASGSEVTVTGVSRGESVVTVTASDGRGGSVSQDFAVTVPNRAPAAVGSLDRVSVYKSYWATVDVSGAFSDPDGDGLTYRASSSVWGVVAVEVIGSRVRVRGLSRRKTTVTVTADDGHGGTAEQVFEVEVPNRPPARTGSIEARTIAPGERFTVTVSDYFREIDGDTLTYTGEAVKPGVVEVSVEGAELAVTGVARGSTWVWAKAHDGRGGTGLQGFLVTVTNGAPSFGADAYEREVAENSAAGTAVGEPVAATDGDGDAVTHGFAAGGDEALFGIDGPSGQITVADGAALDYESGDTVYAVRVVASDGGLADTVGVTIRVTDVPAPGRPDAPAVTGGTEQVAVSWSAPSNEGPEITGYDLRYRAKTDSAWTDASALGAVLTHTVTGLDAGTAYLVQVRAESSEGTGEWSEPGEGATEAANRAPSFGADAYEREVAENSPAGTAVGEPITATDDDGDDLAYSFVVGGGAPFEIHAGTGRITVADGAALDYESGDTVYAVRVVASDGTLADTAALTIRVTDVPAPGRPDAPVVTGGAEQVTATWSAPANEGPEITGYDLRHRASSDGEWTDVSALRAVLMHTVTGLEAGTAYLVQVRAESSEGAGEWSEPGEGATEAANRAPAFGADAYEREVAENSAAGTAVGAPVTADDDDGDDLAYSFVADGDGAPFEIHAGTGRITVAAGAALDYESGDTLYTVSVEASDGTLADTAAVTIRVTDVPAPGRPDAPVVTGGTEELAVSWSAPSNEGPEITNYDLRYRAKADSAWTDLSALGAVLTHTVAGLDAGTAYSVQVRAESSEGAGEWSEPGEGTTTEAANRAPSFGAEAQEREVAENSPGGTKFGKPVAAIDADGDELVYGFVGGADEALFEIIAATGRLRLAADAALNYESGDTLYTVRVEASDGTLADTAAVTIRVTNADDPGEVTLSPEAARVGVELTATLTDEDGVHGAGPKRRWQRSADGSAWNDIGTGRMYNPVTADAGRWLRVVFTYTDGHGPDKRAVSAPVKVLAANVAPVFGEDAYEREVAENSPGGTKFGKPAKATDGDGDELIYSLVGGGDDAPFEIVAATGRLRLAADAALNYESGDTLFTVRVEASDGKLADTASVTIRVTDADDPGRLTLSPEVARVGVEITMTLTDEDGVREAGRKRTWQRSRNGSAWNDIGTGRMYNPVTADAGRWLRAVFTYTDRHGPGKRAESAPVRVLAANAAPSFPAAYEREVPENSPGGTKVGAPVAATDPDGTSPSYSLVGGGDEALFEIGASTGQITVAADAVLNYESADTLHAVRVEASDGELADTASVTIRVTNADDPGRIALSADVARVGVRLTATLMDEDRSIERSKMRTWQRSPDGARWTMVVQGAERRFYTPTAADRGKYLRAVFTYADGHGPGKRAESPAVAVVGASTPVVSFGADSYTAAAGGSADVAVLLSPAASAALAIEVVAGDSAHTVTFQSGASTASLVVGTAGLSASDTLDVRFGTLPEGVAVGVPAITRIVVAATAGDRVSRAVVEDVSPTELEVEYAQATYSAVAGGPGTGIALRMNPATDRRVAVPLTATHAASVEPMLPDSAVFEPGDSLVAFMLEVPAGSSPGLLALGFGALPEAVSAGAAASATVAVAARDTGALRDEAFDLGLAVFGRAVAEGARQAIGARIDAVMRPGRIGSGSAASEWAGRAAGTLASITGLPLGASSATDMVRRSGSVDLPTGRDAAERLLPRVSFATALGPQSSKGRSRFGLWAEGSAQSFRGEPGIDYDGGLRALTVGADARIGSSALLGLSVMRSDGDLDYGHRAAEGSLGHAMNSVHPYLFVQPSPRIGLWAMAGYGGGDVRDGDRNADSGASLRMLSGGVRVPLARSGAFGLALTGDAFGVGMSADDGRREGSATRARALLEASWANGGLKLATQAGARYDAGDADTGGGTETGASVGYAGHGLDLDLRGRLAHGSGRHREWGAALRLAFDPGTRGEGFRLAISPRHGHDRSGIHGLLDGRTLYTMTPAGTDDRQWRLDAEAGYALKNPRSGGAFDGYTRLSAGAGNRAWSLGTGYHVSQTMRLAIEGSRALSPDQPGSLGLRLALDYKF